MLIIEIIKLVLANILSYLIVYNIFFYEFYDPIYYNEIFGDDPQRNAINLIIIIYGFIAFISTSYSFVSFVSKYWKSRQLKVVVVSLLILPALIFNTVSNQKKFYQDRSVKKQEELERAIDNQNEMRRIVSSISLGDAEFGLHEEDNVKEIIVKISFTIDQNVVSSSKIKRLDHYLDHYFTIGFNNVGRLEDYYLLKNHPIIENCTFYNQTIRYEDPRVAYVNELYLNDPDLAFYVSLYLSGSGCDLNNLQSIIGQDVYVYSYLNNNYDYKQVVRSYTIDKLN